MDDPLSRGLPFELADIWRQSALHDNDLHHSLFAPLDASFPELHLQDGKRTFEEDLIILPLDHLNGAADEHHLEPLQSEVASPNTEPWSPRQPALAEAASIWELDVGFDTLLPEGPRLHSWEAFEKKNLPSAERIAFLSEAGPRAFDAALAEREGNSNGVLPQDVMLRALCNLALSRASVFFRWDEAKSAFVATLEDVPISGYSWASCDSFVRSLMEYATLNRSLRASSTNIRSRRAMLPSVVAFNDCVRGVLDAVEESFTKQLGSIRSVLQLQALINPAIELVNVMRQLRNLVAPAQSNEEAISALSDRVYELVSANGFLAGILRIVLERTSAPWLEQLAIDVGLIDDPAASQEDEENDELGNSALAGSTVAAQRQADGLPEFMSSEDRAMIHGTKSTLRVLRKSLPRWQMGSGEARRLLQTALPTSNNGALAELTQPIVDHGSPVGTTEIGSKPQHWAEEDLQRDSLAQIDLEMSSIPQSSDHLHDDLQMATTHFLETSETPVDLAASLVFDLSPLDRIRPALRVQQTHLNRTILHHLFNNGLLHHLRLQRDYHFLGSGEFVTRLSAALFGADTQSAERRRGNIPTSQTMGLRLGTTGTEQRWPPASSELRLTLLDVLTETYRTDHPSSSSSTKARTDARGPTELPGALSFSIRELPDPEIERVLDPASLFALDFLRLSYTAPAPLDAVFTPASMRAYDAVLRLLLRALRVLHVTTSLTRGVAARQQQRGGRRGGGGAPAAVFAHRAHAFVTALMSCTLDTGIAAPWRTFMRALDVVRASLAADDDGENPGKKQQPIGLDALRELHTACLAKIRTRLFLRRKQEKLRRAVDEVLSAVLRGVATVEKGDVEVGREWGGGGLFGDFDRSVTELLTLLRGAAEKAAQGGARKMTDEKDDDDDGGVEMMRLLMARLDWNGFYHDKRSAARP